MECGACFVLCLSVGCQAMACLAGCDAETLLEGCREVRDVLETYIETGIRDAATTLEQIKGCAQTTICEPTLG